MAAFKLNDWNNVVRRVNALIDNGCAGGTRLEEAGPNHIFKKGDIQSVRDTLTAMCSNHPQFTEKLTTWRQSIIDEINAAIDGCRCGPLTYSWSQQVTLQRGSDDSHCLLTISPPLTTLAVGASAQARFLTIDVQAIHPSPISLYLSLMGVWYGRRLVTRQSVPQSGQVLIASFFPATQSQQISWYAGDGVGDGLLMFRATVTT